MIFTPYSNLFFFLILFAALIPAIVLGLKGKSLKIYGYIFNLVMIFVMFSGFYYGIYFTLACALIQVLTIKIYHNSRSKNKSLAKAVIAVIIVMIPMIFFKNRPGLGFLGASYFTFRAIQIIIESYDGLITKFKLWESLYFIYFFPSFTSGPIDRSRRFAEDINKVYEPKEYAVLLRNGLWKIMIGVSYKFIFGAVIAEYWMDKIPKAVNIVNSINYMYAYSFYLFFDFAGYSLMAIGAAYIIGIKMGDNFNLPFISKDIKEFWNRWHMSLSYWFRDFIYSRFVMMSMRKEWFKSRFTASYIGYIITFAVMGIWHGDEKYFLIYGIYHGVLISLTDFYQRKSNFYKKNKNKLWYQIVSVVVTFHLICFGFLMFSGFLAGKTI